ncbi:hypothetical protein ASF16_24015 [Acidovorax sp. Leaf78]|nr:hypothetical protein ASF16_24015 [Acidovorax sp. Leaf78]
MVQVTLSELRTMHACPHCQKPGVRDPAVRWSARENPAQCSYCGGLSHVLASTSGAIAMFTWVTLIGGLGLAFALGSVVLAVAAVLVACIGNVWMWHRCALIPIDRTTAQTANRVGWATTALGVMLCLFQ